MHPRLTASNGRVALRGLEGQVNARRFVKGRLQQITAPLSDVLRQPGGPVDCQLLRGAGFLLLEQDEDTGYAFGQSLADGYVGYVATGDLGVPTANTHRVTALATHLYQAAEVRANRLKRLSFGSLLAVSGEKNGFFELIDGTFVPCPHLEPIQQLATDFVATVERFVGVPYLWGGNSIWGMDCSGALQLALSAAGRKCPRDSDMQLNDLGTSLPQSADLMRGDLVFWQGHVGVMRNKTSLIHANAFHMAVAIEPLKEVSDRIKRSGGGPVTARKRLAQIASG